MTKVDVSGRARVPGEVGMVENIIIEAIGSQYITSIIGLIDGPVIPQSFGAEDKYSIVTQLVILDDGKRLKGFPQTNTVGNNTATEAVELVNGTNYTVTLKPEEFLPDNRVADPGCGFNDLVLVELFAAIFKHVMKNQSVNGERVSVGGQILKRGQKVILCVGSRR